jgi:hypothetical protein
MQFAVTVGANDIALLHFLTKPFEREIAGGLGDVHVLGRRISMVKI